MILITNESDLRRFIPNAFTTVKGETPLLQKLTPFLESAEHWLEQYITGSTYLATTIKKMAYTEAVKSLATHIVVNEAMRQAVPALDLVLTPNGFGIVSNSNIAPASKERVERLIASLEEERDNYIEQLLPLLVQSEEWRGTEQYRFFASTLFPNITLATLCGYHANRWKHYLGLKHRASFIEQQLSEEYISVAQMNALRNIHFLATATPVQSIIISALRNIVVDRLTGSNKDYSTTLLDIVNTLRSHPEEFPEWHASPTAALFTPPTFKNKKESKGYWF